MGKWAIGWQRKNWLLLEVSTSFLHPILTEGGAWALRTAELGSYRGFPWSRGLGSLGNKDLPLPPVPRPKCLWVLTAKGKQPPNMHPGLKPFPKHIIKASCDPHICCLLKRFLTYWKDWKKWNTRKIKGVGVELLADGSLEMCCNVLVSKMQALMWGMNPPSWNHHRAGMGAKGSERVVQCLLPRCECASAMKDKQWETQLLGTQC